MSGNLTPRSECTTPDSPFYCWFAAVEAYHIWLKVSLVIWDTQRLSGACKFDDSPGLQVDSLKWIGGHEDPTPCSRVPGGPGVDLAVASLTLRHSVRVRLRRLAERAT